MKKKICVALIVALVVSMASVVSVSAAPKTPKKPSLSTTKTTTAKVTIKATTGKVSGASRYEFRFEEYNSRGKYITGYTLSNTSPNKTKAISRSCSTFKKTVKVRVRAVSGSGKKAQYSSWSGWKSIKIPGDKQPCG